MTRRRVLAAVCLLVITFLTACGGGIFFVSTGTDGTNVIVASGTCTTVQLSNVIGPDGGFVVVTAVTLLNNGVSTGFNFCGNQVSQFAVNSLVTVHFTNGPTCATPTAILIG
ncbi:MAG TPA: hypothetical protein VD837_08225 [Terriglobales bacterium]|nr:hypothetical protein [Terriglobales bacterium]